MPYQQLEHPTDIRLRVWGRNLVELFQDALLGMMQILKSQISNLKSQILNLKSQKLSERKIVVQSNDQTALLIDFLNEVLYQSQVNREIYTKIEFDKLTEKELQARLFGHGIAKFDEDIKAVTYHQAEIKKTPEGNYETIILFDI